MKKLIFIITAAAFGLINILSCSQRSDSGSVKVPSRLEKLSEFYLAAKIHSDALAIFYNEVSPEEVSTLKSGNKTRSALAYGLNDYGVYATKKALSSNDRGVTPLSKKYVLELPQTKKLTKGAEADLDADNPPAENCMDTPVGIYLNRSLELLTHIYDMDSKESTIADFIHSQEFDTFTEEEQNLLMMCFAIYLDSSSYWRANIDMWCDKYGITYEDILGEEYLSELDMDDPYGETQTRGRVTRWEREMMRPIVESRVAMNDVWGAFSAALVGIIPIVGWGVGGAGVIAAAVTGSIGAVILPDSAINPDDGENSVKDKDGTDVDEYDPDVDYDP